MKIEKGVMAMKNGKAWGCVYADGQSTCMGWIDPESAPIHDPEFCKTPTDVTSPYHYDHLKELSTAKLVNVERTTIVTIVAP